MEHFLGTFEDARLTKGGRASSKLAAVAAKAACIGMCHEMCAFSKARP